MKRSGFLVALAGLAGLVATSARAEDANDLAKQLANPVSSLISVPFQFNWNQGIGPDGNGKQFLLNFQPVIPISISEDWNLISRTIVPVINQQDYFPGAGSQFGIGNITESLFFSPKASTADGIIWGVGPIFMLPSLNDELAAADTWGAGGTFVVLKQSKGWTVGMLANQIWGVGDSGVSDEVNSSYLQPFLSYTTPTAWSYTLNTESTYDRVNDQWTVPINAMVSKVVKVGKMPVSIGGGVRYYADSPAGGPEGWGARFIVTLLFPKK